MIYILFPFIHLPFVHLQFTPFELQTLLNNGKHFIDWNEKFHYNNAYCLLYYVNNN